MSLDYFKEEWEKRINMLKNARQYLKVIKEVCVNEISAECKVILFGSVARGNYRLDSDVDVLVIVPNIKDEWDRSKISVKLHKAINAWDPFEIHVITPEEYKNWYSKFIDVWEEIT